MVASGPYRPWMASCAVAPRACEDLGQPDSGGEVLRQGRHPYTDCGALKALKQRLPGLDLQFKWLT